MTTENQDLLPCPCCGGAAALLYGDRRTVGHGESDDSVSIRCSVCGLSMEKRDYAGYKVDIRKAEVTEAWNRRTPMGTQPAAQVQEARPQNCGTGHCSCVECPYGAQEPQSASVAGVGDVLEALEELRDAILLDGDSKEDRHQIKMAITKACLILGRPMTQQKLNAQKEQKMNKSRVITQKQLDTVCQLAQRASAEQAVQIIKHASDNRDNGVVMKIGLALVSTNLTMRGLLSIYQEPTHAKAAKATKAKTKKNAP